MVKPENLPTLSDVQFEVMNVVWDHGPCSASDAWRYLAAKRRISRNSVHTQLVRLEEKGWLQRREENGGVVFFTPHSRETTQQQTIQRLIKTVFDGSAEHLVLALLNKGTLSSGEAARIRKLIAQAERRKS